jgi:hypothetical protein
VQGPVAGPRAGDLVSFDGSRVRIELCDVMSYHPGDNAMIRKQSAEIWLSTDEGRIIRTRTPSAVIVDDTRAGVLRQLADWVESRQDESLAGLVREVRNRQGAL